MAPTWAAASWICRGVFYWKGFFVFFGHTSLCVKTNDCCNWTTSAKVTNYSLMACMNFFRPYLVVYWKKKNSDKFWWALIYIWAAYSECVMCNRLKQKAWRCICREIWMQKWKRLRFMKKKNCCICDYFHAKMCLIGPPVKGREVTCVMIITVRNGSPCYLIVLSRM